MSDKKPELTSDELIALNSHTAVETCLVQASFVTVATALVNQSSMVWPLNELVVDTTSPNWLTAPRIGMLVLLGSTAGGREYGAFYLRDVTTSTKVKIGSIGMADPGYTTVNLRTAGIANNAHVTIIEAYPLFARDQEIVDTVANDERVYKKDGVLYTDQNSKPKPRLTVTNHVVYKLKTGETYLTQVFTVTTTPWLGSQSVSTIAWTIPGAWTVTVGSASTASFTAQIPEGKYWLYGLVTLNDGATKTIKRSVIVMGASTQPIEVISVEDTGDMVGRKYTVELHDQDRELIEPLSLTFIKDTTYFSGGEVETLTDTFAGWINIEGGAVDRTKIQSSLTIISQAHKLDELKAYSQVIKETTETPTGWNRYPTELCTVSYVAYRALEDCAINYTDLFNFFPIDDSVFQYDNRFYLRAETIYKQVVNLAEKIRLSNAGTDSDGDMHLTLDNSMLPIADRTNQRGEINVDMYKNATYKLADAVGVKNTTVVARYWNGAALQNFYSIAPNKKGGQGKKEIPLPDQIIDSQEALNVHVGLAYGKAIKQLEAITFDLIGNYDIWECIHGARIPFTLDAQYSPTGIEISGYGRAVTIAKTRRKNGAASLKVTIEPESYNVEGVPNPPPPPIVNAYGAYSNIPVQETTYTPFLGGSTSWGQPNDFSPVTAPEAKIKIPILAKDATGSGFRITLRLRAGEFKDISPTSGQRTTLGAAICLKEDTLDPKKLWLLCESGIAYCKNYLVGGTALWVIATSDTLNGPVDLTYSYGGTGGPATAQVNVPFTVNSSVVSNGTFCENRIGIEFSDCVKLTVLSQTGYTPFNNGVFYPGGGCLAPGGNASGVFRWGYTPCGGAFVGFSNTDGAGGPVEINSVYPDFIEQIGGTSSAMWSLTCKLTATQVSIGTNCSDLSISQGGNVYWLSHKDVSGTEYLFINYTRNQFQSVSSTQVALYSADMTYSITISSANPAHIWVTAGDPAAGTPDAFDYFSSTGGVSFVPGAEINLHGGAQQYPYSLPGGGKNKQSKNLLYTKGNDTDFEAVRDGFPDASVSSGTSDYPLTPHSLVSYKLDGNYAALMLKSRDLYISPDGGKTWDFASNAPGSGDAYSLTGWPTNKNMLVAAGDETFAFTVDRGTNWVDAWSEYDTFRTGYGAGVAQIILSAFIGLAPSYKKGVV